MSDNGVFYDCIKTKIERAVVAFVSWIFHCAIETHERWFTKTKMFQKWDYI